MKKQLLAMAVAATFAAPAVAQQVTVSGTLDISPISNTKTQIQGSSTTETRTTTATTTGGNWATSLVNFQASEDLGGGLKATAFINQVVNATTGEFTARDRWIELSGGFGSIKAGRFSPAAEGGYTAFAVAGTTNSAGTTDSSAYDLFVGTLGLTDAFSRSTPVATVADNQSSISSAFDISSRDAGRQAGIVQFTTPSMGGLKATLEVIQNSDDRDAAARTGEAETKQQGVVLAYTAGPLSVSGSHTKRSVKREAAGASSLIAANGAMDATSTVFSSSGDQQIISGTAAIVERKVESAISWLGASYNLGSAIVQYSYATRKDEMSANNAAAVTQSDLKVHTVGVKVPVGPVTLSASTYDGDDSRSPSSTTDDVNLKGHQLGIKYDLSKRTYAYGVMGVNKATSSTTTNNTKREQTNFGVVHTF
jgi:predicted porin